MNNQQPYYHSVYDRLLADIRVLTRLPLGTPEEISDDWYLIQGPKLDKQLLMYLEGRQVYPDFPEWLKPLSERFRIYDSATDLHYLRQLLVFCYKVEFEPTDEQLNTAVAAFVDTDREVFAWEEGFPSSLQENRLFFRNAQSFVSQVIAKCDWTKIVPSHGPGAVFPPCKPVDKSNLVTCYPSITQHYPLDQYYCGIPSFWNDVLVLRDNEIAESSEIIARLVPVPKDSRGPRLICVHPKEAIWIQQGQRRVLEQAISSHRLTAGRINFTDQTVNGLKAKEASLSREYSTIDLSEASDRISSLLVSYLLGKHVDGILSCSRASAVQLPDGSIHRLRKWAPMGNALTFPVESLIFWAVVRAGIKSYHGEICDDIFIFGDDIIVPARFHKGAIRGLIQAGMKPNENKTFVSGFFRESCGVDAYKGFNVTPLRMRQCDIVSIREMTSNLDLAKRLRLAGFEETSAWIYSSARKRLGYLPLVNDPDSVGWYEYVHYDMGKLLKYEPRAKWSNSLHVWRVPIRRVTGSFDKILKDDWYHLQDSLLRLSHSEVSDRGLEYPRPYADRLTYGWSNVLV